MALLVIMAATGDRVMAESAADRAERLARGLDDLVSELEQAQNETEALRSDLARLEALSITHEAALAEQARRLDTYHRTVTDLETQARSDLIVAHELQNALDRERAWNSWLIPIAATAVTVAVLEAVVLVAGAR